MPKTLLRIAFVAVLWLTAVAGALAAPLQFDHDDPLFRLLTAAPEKRFTVAAEIILDPEGVSTEEIRARVGVAPFKYLFRASKTAQAALDFVLLKRSGETIPVPEASTSTQAPNILLVSIAGLRADFVGVYGQPLPTTPRLDALAADGSLFIDVNATSSWSLAANASLLTSHYPSRHGLDGRSGTRPTQLARTVPTLGEALQKADYDTAAIVGDADLVAFRRLDRGFDVALPRASGAADVTARARLWLEWHAYHVARGLEPDRFFLFVQFDDLDTDTAPVAAYRALFAAADDSGEAGARATYAAKVRAIDDQLGILLDALAMRGLVEDTIVVVTGSHGRELGERGASGDATSLHVEQLRVPLVLRFPGVVAAGKGIDGAVSQLDVMPTLLAWSGAPMPANLAGIDLSGIIPSPGEKRPQRAPERDLFAELGPANREWHRPYHERSIRSGDWKLLVRRNADGSNRRALFSLGEDPLEQHDRSGDARLEERVAELETRLRAHMAAALEHDPTATRVVTPAAPAAGNEHGHDH